MNRRYLTLIFLLLTGVAAAQNCGPQLSVPFPDGFDPNTIPVNPQTGQPLLVKHTTAYIGQTVVMDCSACDPEGQPMTVWREDTQLRIPLDPNGVFVLTFSAIDPMTVVIPIGVSDGLDQNTVVGCYAVTFLGNQPPILAGTIRPVGNVTETRLKQKELQIAKKRGVAIGSGRPLVVMAD